MKKPLMSVPPAQAEALYDAALLNAPRGRGLSLPVVTPSHRQWELLEWVEDDVPAERAEIMPKAHPPLQYTETSPARKYS